MWCKVLGKDELIKSTLCLPDSAGLAVVVASSVVFDDPDCNEAGLLGMELLLLVCVESKGEVSALSGRDVQPLSVDPKDHRASNQGSLPTSSSDYRSTIQYTISQNSSLQCNVNYSTLFYPNTLLPNNDLWANDHNGHPASLIHRSLSLA